MPITAQTSEKGYEDNVEKRQVVQFHFTVSFSHILIAPDELMAQVWPDHGVPEHPEVLLSFMDTVDDIHLDNLRRYGPHPLVVHCRCVYFLQFMLFSSISAGIGRTGSYIVIDSVCKKLREERASSEHDYSLQAIVSAMRDQVYLYVVAIAPLTL